MGNTIRREPVNFDIPNSPNYKFLNITNFRGLDISSNPFELATNTASDCLNVYVDETNTLTTRPRLQKKYVDLLDKLFNDTVLGVYPISKGYLIHTKSTLNSYYLWLFDGSDVYSITASQSEIPKNAFKVFEQNNKVYILDGVNYLVINFTDETVPDLDVVKGYVPITASVSSDGRKTQIEPLNLLTDEYIEKHYWDGTSEINTKDAISVQNNTYKESSIEMSDGYSILTYFDDDTFLCYSSSGLSNNWSLYYGVVLDNYTRANIVDTGIVVPSNNLDTISAAKSSKDIVILSSNTSLLYRYTNGTWVKTAEQTTVTTNNKINISAKGTFVWFNSTATQILIWNTKTNEFSNTPNRTQYNNVDFIFTDDETYGVEDCKAEHTTTGWLMHELYFTKTSPFQSEGFFGSFINAREEGGYFSPDGAYFYAPSTINDDDYPAYSGNIIYLIDIVNKKMTVQRFDYEFNVDTFGIYNDKVYIRNDNKHSLYYGDVSNPTKVYNSYINTNGYSLVKYNPQEVIVTTQYTPAGEKLHALVWGGLEKQTISITYKLDMSSSEYLEWVEKNNKLLTAKLYTRFDNNYWFANGNRYYRSQYNDPTYFPATEYNDLGDVGEDITGFNIANDTTLLAYKEKSLYLIQPFTSSLDTTEYTITESKNTVGNTAIDAPIVTTLTEIPLQINYDGIYGLSQLKNVSAIERIADLMSRQINDRWLNEDDEIIKKAMTLNRLYWTYIILPYDKTNKIDPRDVTKIYLLDNRTNSWYYWELPMVVMNAFVVDNRVEFVDGAGEIYTLTTTDIINKNFDTQLITEYYDDGKKLIPWYWQSQIMYLGTMNYTKRLVNTTFIMTDTDTQDGYGLKYSFKIFRKLASSTPEKEISDQLTLVRSTTKKTNISKFGFIQMRISNITEESQGTEAEKAYRNNKLRLVGLGLKYVLLEGLIR